MDPIKKIFLLLKNYLSDPIIGVNVDDEVMDPGSIDSIRGEVIIIYFTNGALRISTDDSPLVLAEADLIFEELGKHEVVCKPGHSIGLDNIRVWTFKPKGILQGKYLNQVEFMCAGKVVLSVGFWGRLNGKDVFLPTGEIFISNSTPARMYTIEGLTFEELCQYKHS